MGSEMGLGSGFKDFGGFSRIYMERYSKVNKRSYKRDEFSLKHMIPFFEGMTLDQINPLMIEDYKAKRLTEGVTPSTINRELILLKHIYTKYGEWFGDGYSVNPVKKVKFFKTDNSRVRFISKEEIKVLFYACPAGLKPIVMCALYTGMRLGEILDLTWNCVDFDRQLITIKLTKNGEVRYCPINPDLSAALGYLRDNKRMGAVYVFCNQKGDKYKVCSISHSFAKLIKKIGIKDFRFHDLRHTFASHLVMNGVDLTAVQRLLGHKSQEMTQRYVHLYPGFLHSRVGLLKFNMDLGQNQDNLCFNYMQ